MHRHGGAASLEDARRLVAEYVEHYNTVRLHSAIGYITPATSWRDGSRRSFRSGTASWKQARSGGSKRDKRHGRLLESLARATTRFGLGGG